MSNQIVPQGYKQTKVGVIPDDWEVVKLPQVGCIVGGGTPDTTNNEYWNDDIYWFTPTEIKQKYINKSIRKISKKGLAKSSAKILPKNTLLLTSRATIGDIGIALNECSTNQGFQSIIVNDDNSYLYIYYWILDNKKEFIKRSSGSTFLEISKKEIEKISFALPPLKEQEKIANILTTWDDAISKQDELIKAKEELKKGLMQRLLSGDIRFNGFNDEWNYKKLREILKIGSGKDYKHLDSGDIPVYGTGGYMLSVNKYLYDGESVCIGRKGTIDKPMLLNGKFWTVDTLFYTHSYKNSIPKFIYFAFLQINWKKYNEASGVPSLSKSTIETIKIKLPSPQEQQKIAEVLTNADKQTDLLKNELRSLKEQKKGLMQKLLTGEVRVKV